MRTKKQKKIILLSALTGASFVCVLIGFAFVLSPARITFDIGYVGGEQIPAITSLAGGSAGLPTPIRQGHRFEGWYNKNVAGEPHGNRVSRVSNKRMNLVAKWTQLELTASLHVNGEYLRTVIIPTGAQAGNLAAAGFLLTPEEILRFGINPAPLSSDGSGRSYPTHFLGWEYYEMLADGTFVENTLLLREVSTGSGVFQWDPYRGDNSQPVISAENPFRPSTNNIALNALIVAGIGYNTVRVEFRDANNNGISQANLNMVTGELPTNSRWNSTINLPRWISGLPIGRQHVGWHLQHDGLDIITVSATAGTQFFLDPRLARHTINVLGVRTLVFVAVTRESSEGGIFEKKVENGRIVLHQSTSNLLQVNIVDALIIPAITDNRVEFDFSGNQRGRLRSTALASGAEPLAGRFPLASGSLVRDVAVIDRTVNRRWQTVRLPFVNDFAVPGMLFGGWQCGLDGKIYQAGLIYNIPLGTRGSMRFTAVWVDERNLVSFDLAGGDARINEANFRRANASVRLPVPTRFGYEFAGWKNAATNYQHQVGADITLTNQKQHLVAVWNAKPLATGLNIQIVYPNPLGSTSLSIEGLKFGDTIRIPTFHGSNARFDGVRFRDELGSTAQNEVHITFMFGARFVNHIGITIDQDFAERISGVRGNDNRFFNPVGGTIHIIGSAFII